MFQPIVKAAIAAAAPSLKAIGACALNGAVVGACIGGFACGIQAGFVLTNQAYTGGVRTVRAVHNRVFA